MMYHRRLYYQESSILSLSYIKMFLNIFRYRYFVTFSFPLHFLSKFNQFRSCLSWLYNSRTPYLSNDLIMNCYLINGIRRILEGFYYPWQSSSRFSYREYSFHDNLFTINCTICTLLYKNIKHLSLNHVEHTLFTCEERRSSGEE